MAENGASSHRTAVQFGTDSLRVTTAVIAMVGLSLALFALILGMIYGPAAWFFAPYWLAGVGLLAVIFFVVFNFEWLGQVISGRAAMSGMLVAVMCAAAVVVWFGMNYFFNYPASSKLARKIGLPRQYCSVDLTKTRRFTLSDKTLDLLDGLKQKISIKVMWRGSPQEGPQMDSLLECYAEASDMIDLEFLMPTNEDYDRKKSLLANRLNKEVSELHGRSVSLFFEDRFKYLNYFDLWETRSRRGRYGQVQQDRIFKGEEAITSAICGMIDTEKSKVYFVVDHGEKNPDTRGNGNGLHSAGQLLKRSNIDWEVMDLRTKRKIPDDATVVAIIGPRRELTGEEVKVLQTYLDERQGRLLICMDEYRRDVNLGLGSLLAHVGLVAGRDHVIEKNVDFLWGRAPGLFFGKTLGSEPQAMLDTLREANVQPSFRKARSLKRLQGYSGRFSAHELATGSASDSWGETNLDEFYRRGKARFDKDTDTDGPIHYAFACWEGPTPTPGVEKLGRVVVFGDSDWCEDTLMGLRDNSTFFMAVINWLAGKEKRISIEPKLAEDAPYTMKPKHARRLKIVLVTVPILLVLAAGWVLWARRR